MKNQTICATTRSIVPSVYYLRVPCLGQRIGNKKINRLSISVYCGHTEFFQTAIVGQLQWVSPSSPAAQGRVIVIYRGIETNIFRVCRSLTVDTHQMQSCNCL